MRNIHKSGAKLSDIISRRRRPIVIDVKDVEIVEEVDVVHKVIKEPVCSDEEAIILRRCLNQLTDNEDEEKDMDEVLKVQLRRRKEVDIFKGVIESAIPVHGFAGGKELRLRLYKEKKGNTTVYLNHFIDDSPVTTKSILFRVNEMVNFKIVFDKFVEDTVEYLCNTYPEEMKEYVEYVES